MSAETLRHYISRAADFIRGMKVTQNDELYRRSSALLAIHAAVSYSDALRTGLGDRQLSNDDHRTATDKLKQLLNARKYDALSGLAHLHALISKKSHIAYGDRHIDLGECQLLATKAERFVRWANQVGAKLQIEGWRHDEN